MRNIDIRLVTTMAFIGGMAVVIWAPVWVQQVACLAASTAAYGFFAYSTFED